MVAFDCGLRVLDTFECAAYFIAGVLEKSTSLLRSTDFQSCNELSAKTNLESHD